MTASPQAAPPGKRHLIWGGLSALCSDCGWKRTYDRGAVAHKLPDTELSLAISAEFENHDCKGFPRLRNSMRPA